GRLADCVASRFRVFVLFFFSSRRRHTRSKRDWSSDVCSSDLIQVELVFKKGFHHWMDTVTYFIGTRSIQVRSEERRVGKEGRSRGSTDGGKTRREK